MGESTTIIGLDVHTASVTAAVLRPGAPTAWVTAAPAEVAELGRWVQRVAQAGPVQCVYEAGPCGFTLARHLGRLGVPCTVIAPALVPKRAGDRVKTDRRDAQQLAQLFRAGLLTAVAMPTEAEEALRDLVRAREAAVADLLRMRHRLKRFLGRHGRRLTGTKAWSARYLAWVRQQTWPEPAHTLTQTALLRAVDEATDQVRTLEAAVREAVQAQPAVAARVARLRAFRGIDTITAATLVVEFGDPRRFRSAPAAMGYTGLVPREHSSGARRRRGEVTKTGNAHLRRVLVEAAWHYRRGPAVSAALRARQVGVPEEVRRRAWRAQHRLYRRYHRLVQRGKLPVQAVTAVARELVGFVWATLGGVSAQDVQG
jgi:transposase